MRPVLLTWRGRRIYSYPAFLYLGLVSGTIAGDYAAHMAGLNAAAVVAAIVILTIPALAGARLLFVASHWPLYRRQLDRIWRRGDGGAALHGGLLMAVAVSIPPASRPRPSLLCVLGCRHVHDAHRSDPHARWLPVARLLQRTAG